MILGIKPGHEDIILFIIIFFPIALAISVEYAGRRIKHLLKHEAKWNVDFWVVFMLTLAVLALFGATVIVRRGCS